MKFNVAKSRQEGVGIGGWKSYVDDLLNRLTPSCNLPHIIMGIPSKEPERVWPMSIPGIVKTYPSTITSYKDPKEIGY
jgi:hypothetical protein